MKTNEEAADYFDSKIKYVEQVLENIREYADQDLQDISWLAERDEVAETRLKLIEEQVEQLRYHVKCMDKMEVELRTLRAAKKSLEVG